MNVEQKKIVGQIGIWSKLYAITLIFSILMTLFWTGELLLDIINDTSYYHISFALFIVDNIMDIIVSILLLLTLFKISNEFKVVKSIRYDFWDLGLQLIKNIFLFILITRITSWLINIFRRVIEVFIF